jgi:pimeloyl-[acyl-carrier protein] methyl ester esterase
MRQRVFLPGFTMNPLVFAEVAESPDRCLSLPGHGAEPVASALEWLPFLAAQLPEVPSWLIGWSLGGRLALALADFCPQKVAAVTLLASNPSFLAREDWPGLALKNYQIFQRQLLTDTEKTWQQFLHWQFWQQPHARAQVKHWQARLQAGGLPSTAALEQGFFWLEQDARPLWQTLPQPITALFAGQDHLVPSDVVAHLQALPLAASAGLRISDFWPEASHGLPLAHAAALRNWLKEQAVNLQDT